MYLTIVLLGVGLAMDAFAVSISGGLICKKVTISQVLKTSLTFGIYQGVMPFLGYILGRLFIDQIDTFDHYIAFALLGFIGSKMLYDGVKKNDCDIDPNFFKTHNLMILGFATSIDAFLAGLSLSMSDTQILSACLIIGSITFILSSIGVKIGCRLGCKFEKGADIFGGVILIFLGIKTLLEGLSVL